MSDQSIKKGIIETWAKYPILVTFLLAFGVLLSAVMGFTKFPVMDAITSHETLEKARYDTDISSQSIMIEVLRTICVNTSETNAEKNNCHRGAIVADQSL